MTELTDGEIEAIHEAAREAAEHAWVGNIPANPHSEGTEAADIWDYAFRNAYAEINH